ncbi:MAG: M1 family metallopeptidase [Actinomadura sp.]
MALRRTPHTLSLAAATGSVLVLSPVTAARLAAGGAESRPRFTAGAPGLGDPYFPLEGNGGYDVRHYGLTFSYDPATDRLDGTAVITARATQNLSRFDLDLKQLDVRAVTVDGRAATFTRRGQELVITPPRGLREATTFVVAVTYGGVPRTIADSPVMFGSPYGFVHTDDGVFTGDQPNAASTWFPSNDHPSDKAAFTFRVTVPKGLGVIAGGRLVSRRTSGDRTTYVWDARTPMSTYLATAGIGRWTVRTGTTPGGVPMTVAVDPKLAGRVREVPDPLAYFWDTTGEATDLWVRMFGPYPFDSTGAIADLATYGGKPIGFSLETQTRPLYSDVRDRATIAHEIAHQWFGDSVSLRSWRDIWLNESFATFAELYWNERHGGRSLPEQARLIYGLHPAGDPWWNVEIADPGRNTMFHDRVYKGGAMVLQFLRERIGDEKFFPLLRTWLARHAYGTATTAQFTTLAGEIAGQDLSGFFDTWIHSTGKPALA